MLGVWLWSKQKEILRSVFRNRKTVVPAGHGVGKTFVAAVIALTFLYVRKPAKVLTTAPTWLQVKRLLWSEMNRLFKERLVPQNFPGKISQTQLHLRDDWFALGLSPKESVNLQGFHGQNVLVIFDEASGIRRELYEAADSLLSGGDARILLIGNPTGARGPFYDACRSEGWHVIRLGCLDSPNLTGEKVPLSVSRRLVTPEWVVEKQREWGEDSPQYFARVLGQFPPTGDDQLIGWGWVEEALGRESLPGGVRRLGVDVARFGEDATVYTILEGHRVFALFVDRQKDTMHIAGRICHLMREYGIESVAVDDTGVGGGVTDRLRELGVRVQAIQGGAAAREPHRFFNRRTELWWILREWIRTEGVLLREPRLIEDLTAPRFRYTSRGQIRLESKEETKRRLGRSPDYGDSLVLALAASENVWETFWDGGDVRPLARDFPV